jgi:hypothetical protein
VQFGGQILLDPFLQVFVCRFGVEWWTRRCGGEVSPLASDDAFGYNPLSGTNPEPPAAPGSVSPVRKSSQALH